MENNVRQSYGDFLSIIYFDKHVSKGCVIERINNSEGTIKIRYADLAAQMYNEVAVTKELIKIGKLEGKVKMLNGFDDRRYDHLSDRQIKLFKEQIGKAVENYMTRAKK